jgi:hypothetical protein
MKKILLIALTFISVSSFSQSCQVIVPDNVADPSIPGVAMELSPIDTHLREFMNLQSVRGGIYLTNENHYVIGSLIYFKNGNEEARILFGHNPQFFDKKTLDLNAEMNEVPKILEIDLILEIQSESKTGTPPVYSLQSASVKFETYNFTWPQNTKSIKNFPSFVAQPPFRNNHPYRDSNLCQLDITSIHGFYDGYAICNIIESREGGMVLDSDQSSFSTECTSDIKKKILG